jgi:hypothetical protein
MLTKATIASAVAEIEKAAPSLAKDIIEIVQKSASNGRIALQSVAPSLRETRPLLDSIVEFLDKSLEQSANTLGAIQENIDGIASSAAQLISVPLNLLASWMEAGANRPGPSRRTAR